MKYQSDCLSTLQAAGISWDDACALRRISMTLHRWHELECGDGNDATSWCVVRGYWRNGAFEYDDNGDAYMERHYHRGEAKAYYHRVPDRERGARKRLVKIMARYPAHQAYVQTDPRGCALYIGHAGEALTSSNYSRGIAVYK